MLATPNIFSCPSAEFEADCRLRPEKVGMDMFFCVQRFGSAQAEIYKDGALMVSRAILSG
jgi:hypothetical protein